MKMMMMINMIMNMMFLMMKHPLSMGMMIIIQTTIISMISGMMFKTFWFSYILFLMFVGGMMVLFIYMTSLVPNMMFKVSAKQTMIMLMTIIVMITMMKIPNEMLNNDMINMKSMMLMKMYNNPTNMSIIMLAMYLFFTMITVFKISESNKGPLRMSK